MGTGYDAGVSQVSSASILGHSISAEHVRHGVCNSADHASVLTGQHRMGGGDES